MSAQFNIPTLDPILIPRLQKQFKLPRFIVSTLIARGIDTPEKIKIFLEPSLERDWLDPYLIPGLSEVADSLENSIKAKEHIIVFGDFDLDGISATATLTRGLRELGGTVTPFIPLRFEEGYSLSEAALKRVFALNPDIIVTVDCGIASKHEVDLIQKAGVKVLITDHHEPADLVPAGIPVADPKLDENCPSTILAGVGVALKLIQVLGGRMGSPHLWREYTDLAALGTVADLMPLVSENRALVAEGIKSISEAPRSCIAALLGTVGAEGKEVSAHNISFSIIPRLNAAGRMGDAQLALDLLLCDNFDEACKKARELEELNDRRRIIEAELSEAARAQAVEAYQGQRVLVVSGSGWHEGVKGIVASRLVNSYGVPALLFTIDGNEARGSGRSVGSVNLFKAVESTSDILTRFGGHEAAVGVTLPSNKLEEFIHRLQAFMDELPAESFIPRISVDACVELDEISIDSVAKLDLLAPFGQENSVPCFMARDVMLSGCRAVGAEKNHFSCTLSDGRRSLNAIMFHCSNIDALMHCGTVVNAAFELQIDEWRGKRSVKAIVSALSPAQSCGALEACLDPESIAFVSDLYEAGDDATVHSNKSEKERAEYQASREKNRRYWERIALEDPDTLQEKIIEALIGDNVLHESQKEVLDHLAAKNSTLAIMPTSRGKSLLFQVHATKGALLTHAVSLFVYPLRALIADQAFHIRETLEAFGITSAILTGETDSKERTRIYNALSEGTLDIVLTTPEFLSFHARKIAQASTVDFVVVDEAHHIGLAKAGQRTAYARLGETISMLGNPDILALTATADEEVFQEIITTLDIKKTVFDEARRENLRVNDQRNIKERERYLANLIAQGEKTVIYVNSREHSVRLARSLRKMVPQMASLIGFYNAGLTRNERKRIEELFRTNGLCVLVATSAFGEGVNIPDIRHAVLYHLPFNEIEFNQMSGRAGRDGKEASIDVLFGRSDVEINERILTEMTPGHDTLAQIYRELREKQRDAKEKYFPLNNEQLAQASTKRGKRFGISDAMAACGVSVFKELGLIDTKILYENGKAHRLITVDENASKVELTDSIRYCEGIGEREVFNSFCEWVLRSDKAALQKRISQAILPYQPGEEDRKGGL